MYKIYGNFDMSGEQVLEEFARRSEAIRWAEGYCKRDLGGYSIVEVVSLGDDAPVIHWAKSAETDD